MDISGFGARVRLVADKTFPQGIELSQFADDADPFDIPATAIRDKAMGVNGDLVTWGKATPIDVTLNMIPGSDDDANLQALADANRVGKGKTVAADVVTVTVIYPDGNTRTFEGGSIINAPAGKSIASAGRLKSQAYQFTFENVS